MDLNAPKRAIWTCLIHDEPSMLSREALAPAIADLNKYAAIMHFVGRGTIFSLTGDPAAGAAYTLAHHLTIDDEKRRLMMAGPLRGHVREHERRVDICGAPALRRLD